MKADLYYTLAKELKEKKLPLDGVGFQFHIDMNYPPKNDSIYRNIKRFNDLGLVVDFTEIDVRSRGELTPEKSAIHSQIYADLADIFLSSGLTSSFTTWGVTDKYSWIPSFFTGYDNGLLFDKEYMKKEAYNKIFNIFKSDEINMKYSNMLSAEKSRITLSPFIAKVTDSIPKLDGIVSNGEWKGITYSFGYNQLGKEDQRPPEDLRNSSGEWQIMYKGNKIYGLITRTDDLNVSSRFDMPHENDCIEVFIKYNDLFNQIRSIAGSSFEMNSIEMVKEAVWNKERTIVEFMIELPEPDLTGLTIGFNIALSDNDYADGQRSSQLYPTQGDNTSWQGKNLSPLKFEGNTPRPSITEWPVIPFKAHSVTNIPIIDGIEKDLEFDKLTKYKMPYNQYNKMDLSVNKLNNSISCEWSIGYKDNKIIGYIKRIDNKITAGDIVSIALENDKELNVYSAQVGKDFVDKYNMKKAEIKWNSNMTYGEFYFELETPPGKGTIQRFNILTLDDDGNGTDSILYPINGNNDPILKGNFGELSFE